MGLEIFYDLHAPITFACDRVRSAVECVRDIASELSFAEVGSVVAHDPNYPKTLGIKDGPEEYLHLRVTAVDGWYFRTWPGEGCETAFFGLCLFPGTIVHEGKEVPTGWGEGWHYHSWCKTQYADRVSREHFLRCHRGVVAVLDAFRVMGVAVNARDASGYWQQRDLAALERSVNEWNGIVAAVAGAVKDALDDSAGSVVSPMFAKSDFERLEAEGREIMRRKQTGADTNPDISPS